MATEKAITPPLQFPIKDRGPVPFEDRAGDSDYFFDAAAALIDASVVLSALERAPVHTPNGCLQTGESFATGYSVGDDTIPTLLEHSKNLLHAARAIARRQGGGTHG